MSPKGEYTGGPTSCQTIKDSRKTLKYLDLKILIPEIEKSKWKSKSRKSLECSATQKAKLENQQKSAGKDSTTWKVAVFGVFLVIIFLHMDWIRRYKEYLSVISPNAGKYGPQKIRLRTLFTQCLMEMNLFAIFSRRLQMQCILYWYLPSTANGNGSCYKPLRINRGRFE